MQAILSFLRRCVSTPFNALVTLLLCWLLWRYLPGLVDWLIVDAVWQGSSPQACANVDAACWLFIRLRFNQILFGLYPAAEQWRPILCAAIGAGWMISLNLSWGRWKGFINLGVALVFVVAAAILLRGGILGLPPVATSQWGGILLSVIVAAWTIASSIPLGLLLALARRSTLPVVSIMATLYIELIRGLPLVGVLFLAIVLFPLFVPPGIEVDVLLRTLTAFTLFNAANMAEAIRGGLQSVPKGQFEASMALGLGYWQTMIFTVIPQALRVALPGLINISISIIKETTIILMAGLFDFVGTLQGALLDPEWIIGDQVRVTAYVFASIVFFVVCFALSKYSARLERRLDTADRG